MLHRAENSWTEFSASTTLGKRGTRASIHRRFWKFKIEGVPRRMDGKMRPVEIYYRDYESVNGLMLP